MVRCILAVIVIGIHLVSIPVYTGLGKGIARPQNVIVIVVDTLGAQHLSFMGYERETSPFIDALASRSVVFDRAYTPKSTTEPAFTSIMTGLHPSRHGVIENGVILPDELHFLTENIRDAGFETWGVAASRVISMQYGFGRGFNYYANTPPVPRTAPEIRERLERILKGTPRFGEPSLALNRKPLFLFVHLYDTHTPFTPNDEYLGQFGDLNYDGPVDGTWAEFEKFNDYEIAYDEVDLQHTRDMYDAEIRALDDELKLIFELFDEAGLLDNAVVVFSADHGESLGEHHFITHGHPYEKALHVPLLINFPNDEYGGTRISSPVENTDILPSILDIYDVEIPQGLDGRSLVPLFVPERQGEFEPRDYLYAIGNPTNSGRTFSVCDGRFRLVTDTGKAGETGLYDILKDPEEIFDICNNEMDVTIKLAYYMESCIEGTLGATKADAEVDEETRAMLASLGYVN